MSTVSPQTQIVNVNSFCNIDNEQEFLDDDKGDRIKFGVQEIGDVDLSEFHPAEITSVFEDYSDML